MEKILLALVALCATMSMNAQVIEIYDNDDATPIAIYKNGKGHNYKVIFKEAPITGNATRKGDEEVKWVQLWKDGPKFAEYNIGAENNKAEDFGGYYAWGGHVDKNATYKKGTSQLSGDDDTATNLWGDNWRMPTSAELTGLLENCTFTLTTQNDVYGMLCTGKGAYSSNSIFLPAAGVCNSGSVNDINTEGFYWASTTPNDSSMAGLLYIHKNSMSKGFRESGCSVRAVLVEYE